MTIRHYALSVVSTLSLLALCGVSCNLDRTFPKRERIDAPIVGEPYVPKGGPAATPNELMTISQQEVDLVEATLAARNEYHRRLTELRDYYRGKGYVAKASWADFELTGARNIKQFRYLMDSEVPALGVKTLRPIPEADKLYEEGMAIVRKGGVFYREKSMAEAAQIFRRMIEQYPESDKIDDAAFQLGEIHKDYLPKQEGLAVTWYERAYTWNPQTPYPARYNAAVVCDYRLNDKDKALELYRQVVDEETEVSKLNRRFAMRRIESLSRGERPHAGTN